MAGPAPDWSRPDPTVNKKFDDLNMIRLSMWPTFVASALHAGAIVPGWDLISESHDSDSRPLSLTFRNQQTTPQQCNLTYTYSGSSVATVRFQWDYGAGAGFENFANNIATINTGANNVIETITWS